MTPESQSKAAEYLKAHPEIENQIRNSAEFANWRKQFKKLDIDNETYYVREGKPMVSGGDTLLDEYELMLEWAQQAGIPMPK
ncbi:MAG: hypothetical protein AB7H90_20090 [Alphaproteobacteria bacterium]